MSKELTNSTCDFFGELANQFAILADAARFEVVFALLREGELNIEELGERLDQNQSDLVRQLDILVRSGMVKRIAKDLLPRYALQREMFGRLIQSLMQLLDSTIATQSAYSTDTSVEMREVR